MCHTKYHKDKTYLAYRREFQVPRHKSVESMHLPCSSIYLYHCSFVIIAFLLQKNFSDSKLSFTSSKIATLSNQHPYKFSYSRLFYFRASQYITYLSIVFVSHMLMMTAFVCLVQAQVWTILAPIIVICT